jgi:Phosphoserine phosphatase RsbU, N-terminal domain
VSGPGRRFRVAYDAAFWGYLLDPGEPTLRTAYELGRDAVAEGLSALDLAAAHHEVLAAALERAGDTEETVHLARAAGDVFLESLSAFEMVARGFRDAREAATLERRQAAVVRRLSTFLADASLAVEGSASLAEALQLVAEQARELTGADRCEATLLPDAGDVSVAARADIEPAAGRTGETAIASELTTLDGRVLGTLRLVKRGGGGFGEADAAILAHLAQMTSAAVERGRLYGDAPET